MNFLNRVEFGPGAVEMLPQEIAAAGIRRAFLVTDPGLVATGLPDRIVAMAGIPVITYATVPPNPTEDAVLAARAIYLDENCDGIIAVGGGSPLDFGKTVTLLASHELPLERYAAIHGGAGLIGPTAPVIVIPTTAGTGSEVGRGALITLASGSKLAFASRHLLPAVALCDPTLTISLPPLLTAATGMDAFSHCVEAYLSPRYNPPVDSILLGGAARIWRALPTAVERPQDMQARTDMMMGSIEGGLGFQKGLGAVHALSHPLGALKSVSLHHGCCNAAILPAVLRFNRPAAGSRIADLERALGLPSGMALEDAVARLNADLGLPVLRRMGIVEEMIPGLIPAALADHSRPTNPRELTEQDVRALYLDVLA